MAYSEVDDLLLGDLVIPTSVSKEGFVNGAADDIDSKIGFRYKVPIDVSQPDYPPHQRLLLKSINNKLASGRLILTLDVAEEGSALHSYGLFLVREANADLLLIANGDVDLRGTEPTEGGAGRQTNRTPTVFNHDAVSGVEAFEQNFMGGQPVSTGVFPQGWVPGSA